jgi:hypothetical protein
MVRIKPTQSTELGRRCDLGKVYIRPAPLCCPRSGSINTFPSQFVGIWTLASPLKCQHSGPVKHARFSLHSNSTLYIEIHQALRHAQGALRLVSMRLARAFTSPLTSFQSHFTRTRTLTWRRPARCRTPAAVRPTGRPPSAPPPCPPPPCCSAASSN